MDKEKPKIKIKASTKLNTKLVLKKEFIIKKEQETLVLRKIIEEDKKKIKVSKNKLKIASSNIIKLKKEESKKEILSISKVSKSLGGKPILKNITFSLRKGQILGFL